MNLERYALEADPGFTIFEFVSVGCKGEIVKVIQFQQTEIPDLYNLAFGDKKSGTGEFDDRVVTDNGDSKKVLATVVDALYAFIERYPDKWVYATGSTTARTRLYQMGINKYLDMAESDFDIIGECQGTWERYRGNTKYEAFAVRLRHKQQLL